ncbi:MAG: hypothetical protein JST04_04710 [Bdellovibrionales bacterium]|nr:hypothetical protein [Bdellovibrionales bacterium]
MKKSYQVSFVLFAALVLSATAQAEETKVASATVFPNSVTAVGTSSSNGETAGVSSPLDRVYLGLTSTFHGTPVRNMGSEYSVDTTGREKRTTYNMINFDSEVGAGYRVTKDIGVGPIVPFIAVPVRGQGFILGDVGLKAFNSKTIDRNGFRLATNLIVQAPSSDSSKARDMTWALKTTPYGRYQFAHSNVSLGAFTELKDYFGVSRDKTFKVWALPYLGYSLSDSVTLRLAYEMEWHHNLHQSGLETYMTDWQPGVVWNITKQLSINPYVQFYTMNSVDLDHAALGAFLSASVL